MGCRERRQFTDEFKAEVVGLVRSGRTVAEVSRALDLPESAVRTWVHRAEDRVSSLSVAEREKLGRLRREVRVLEEERTILMKAAAPFAKGTGYRFIEVERVNHALRTLCRVLQVSRAAYYHLCGLPVSERARSDMRLTEQIRSIHAQRRQTYGAPRIQAELQTMGQRPSRKRMARIMRLAGLAGRNARRFRCTTVSDPLTQIPDLIQRDFAPTAPNQLWVGDITCVRTWEGWLYLAVLLDCFSRRVVGWAMADHLRAGLPVEALRMALAGR